jgi:triphosphoribosyl-dephospho-CoA synthase
MLSIGFYAQVACIWEATARKPGNVHRFCDFDDTTYLDFLLSAAAIAPVLDAADKLPVGQIVLEGVRATRRVAKTNTNLGILLLLAPLAAVPRDQDLRSDLEGVLERLTLEDSRLVYEAIRLAAAGGLGRVNAQDVRQEPTLPLRQVMTLAAEWDLIARQYANGFRQVLDEGLPALVGALDRMPGLESAIVYCHLHLLARYPDSLIARKRGNAEAEEASRRAAGVLAGGWPYRPAALEALASLDAWLRGEGHERNPGTTADLVTACLFVALRQGLLQLPREFAAGR